MPTFEVRKNCEYVMHVDAKDAWEACREADKKDESDWNQNWSATEAEKVES